jgi:MFS family permease
MSAEATMSSPATKMRAQDQLLFWGCFIALVTTAFGFIARMFLINTWANEFGLDAAQSGRLAGIGIWPFAVSIIGFSLIIDKIGYKMSMMIAFLGHIIWACMGVGAYFVAHPSQGVGDKQLAYQLLYWGSLILALGNGTVEAFINPVVATMFSKDKTKWLNILHAGWPGGLVIAGMVTIFIDDVPWWVKVGLIAIPAVVYFFMLLMCQFPEQERVSSGVSYHDMLCEFGILGSLIVGFLVTLQLIDFFSTGGQLSAEMKYVFIGIGVAIVVGFGIYTRDLGRFLMFFMILIMMPLATTEIGTDGWITGIMEEVAKGKFHPGWVLVYTSAIMMVLRFFAGPIVHQLSPLGLLAISAVLAIVGLYSLSFAAGAMIFAAATLYAFGKTFFWPTMLGVVSEQMPKGGALTLNAISGIGMLAVGTLGFPYIGTLQADKAIHALAADKQAAVALPGLVKDGKLTVVEDKRIYEIIPYQSISDAKVDDLLKTLPEPKRDEVKKEIESTTGNSKQGALANMIIFPVFMLVCYLILMVYFKSKGGYKPVHLDQSMESEPGF